MKSFIVSCATFHKLLFKKINIVHYEIFSTKLNAHEMFGSEEFRTTFRVARKCIWGLLYWATAAGTALSINYRTKQSTA